MTFPGSTLVLCTKLMGAREKILLSCAVHAAAVAFFSDEKV